ncbi:MAG: acetylglutamate kinase [Clostridia bacterium]|nr:acetylglutamate kinase [Clostridia bacterium]
MNTNVSNSDRAHILVQALPYIKRYVGKTIVVKYGGNAMINAELKDAVIKDLILMQLVGINVILVHGGGPEINAMLKKINKESKFVNGMRYTDQETMDIVQQVLAGKVNKDLVHLIERNGGKAVGLCGADGSLLKADKLSEDLGFVGEIREVNADILKDTAEKGYIPVVSTIATGDNGEVYNINADVAAAKIAEKVGARKLILMTDIRGLLRDKDDENTLIPVVKLSEVSKLKKEGVISGGMIPKIDCCVDAVKGGVHRAHIIDGREPHSILVELFTDEGIGTMFY